MKSTNIHLKLVTFLISLALTITGCGGGDSSVDNNLSSDEKPSVGGGSDKILYPPVERSYPYLDRLTFQRQDAGDTLSLSDHSLWYITGDYSSGYDAIGEHDIDLYDDSERFGVPTSGTIGTHYMYINGSTRAFYLEYIPNLEVVATDILPFHRESLGALLALSNGLLWQVVGDHSSGMDVLGTHPITLYTNLTEMPNIDITGHPSNYYFHINSSSRGFYVEPINGLTLKSKTTANFYRESVGDIIILDDDSTWRLVGEHRFGYDVLDKHEVAVYENTQKIPNPTSGERTDNYLYIYGASVGFFIESI
ncbi:hypothetical protein [Vibrio splendidus]|uniref:Uncharacterized protein n=1 Tax=Vibrio splendidus TaxID=29497 RepID=A0A837NUE0_VIBSP|nr:hypothetical protein [Vibrio splendidus]KPL94440.1 hypothetical protein AN168_12980 [Vibrio splendidus]